MSPARAVLLIVLGIMTAAAAIILLALGMAALTGGGSDGDTIIQHRYEQCIAHGGTYRQGDGFDDFSCSGVSR